MEVWMTEGPGVNFVMFIAVENTVSVNIYKTKSYTLSTALIIIFMLYVILVIHIAEMQVLCNKLQMCTQRNKSNMRFCYI